jgi:hypothetical protein
VLYVCKNLCIAFLQEFFLLSAIFDSQSEICNSMNLLVVLCLLVCSGDSAQRDLSKFEGEI